MIICLFFYKTFRLTLIRLTFLLLGEILCSHSVLFRSTKVELFVLKNYAFSLHYLVGKYSFFLELYRTELIHSSTCIILTDQILALMPSDRNVILTMNEYNISELNPTHPYHPDAPTHIIIFCIRFISDDMFQPVGALMTYKCQDQSYILAQCVKAYIFDLWKLGLYVIATVSPPSETFKRIVSHLADVSIY